ncbi:MAG: hypothetical protein VX593_10570 [Pseudomonadota bacterium]|nr:hypothetical protein [Pseudomonadota bacterium]
MIQSAQFSVLSRTGGSTPNDDRANGACGPEAGHAWVIDGATGVVQNTFIPGAESDAAWIAARLSQYFEGLPISAAPVRVPMRRILGRIRDDYLLAISGRDVPDYALPSAAGLFCGWERCARKIILRMTGLGDCSALLRAADGTTHIIGDLTPGGGDADKLLQFDAFRGAKDEASQQALWSFIKEQRSKMNRPGGYWVFSIAPEAASYLREQTFVLKPPVDILMMTDGFARLVDHFDWYTPETLIAAAEARGLDALYDELRGLEAAEPDCRAVPRVKKEDDASAVFIRIVDDESRVW